MILDFLSGPVGIAAILSFFIGSFGYVIARMWVQPLLRYRLLKSRVRVLMNAVESASTETNGKAFPGIEIRKTAGRLADCTSNTLPQWYRLMLANRRELPDNAVADLMALANMKDGRHASRRVAGVRAALRITPKGKKA